MFSDKSILVTGGTGSFGKAFIKKTIEKFSPKRIVVFSGGSSKDKESLLEEIKELYLGGASGSIIGRNSFQRPYKEAITLLNQIIDIYKGKWFESKWKYN